MSDLSVLQEGRMRRAERAAQARRARRHRWMRIGLSVTVLGLAALLLFMASGASGPGSVGLRATGSAGTATAAERHARASYGATPAAHQVHPRFKLTVRSALLFDVRTGRVLWSREAGRRLPIASLTKMMTALVVADHARMSEHVRITSAATHYSGSGIGLLPLGRQVPLGALLYGLLLPSGNDAAIALAQHVAGTQAKFIAMMNERAQAMGLRCTHFTSVSGIVDQGNYSCAIDLAVMAHAVLKRPLLARIVATRSAILPFPIKGGKLYLYNNNPLLLSGYPGVDGVKTGYTVASGPCLVAAARRGRNWFGVVLLHSDNPPNQAKRLLDAGFAATRGSSDIAER